MANMSYCRFRNTLGDLNDCVEELEHPTMERDEETDDIREMVPAKLNEDEQRARYQLIQLCIKVAENFDPDDYPLPNFPGR